MLDWSQCAAVERVVGKVGGEWLFKGTRVPSERYSKISKVALGLTIS